VPVNPARGTAARKYARRLHEYASLALHTRPLRLGSVHEFPAEWRGSCTKYDKRRYRHGDGKSETKIQRCILLKRVSPWYHLETNPS